MSPSMHRALGLALQHNDHSRHQMVQLLLSSKHPPTPTEKSDFLKLVEFGRDPGMAYTLFEHGFRGKPNTIGRILERIAWVPGIDLSHMKPAYLERRHRWGTGRGRRGVRT